MCDLSKLAGNLSAAAAQEASIQLRQAANLIEQQQREIEQFVTATGRDNPEDALLEIQDLKTETEKARAKILSLRERISRA